MQIEMDVYTLAKKVSKYLVILSSIFLPYLLQWLFLEKSPDWSGDHDKLLGDAEEYFRNKGIRGPS